MIKSVHLDCFKNFRDAELPLGPLTVLVGTNASGKSNVRDAFRFLHGIGRGYSLADIFGEKSEGGVLQWKGIRGGIREAALYGEDRFSLKTVWADNAGVVTHEIQISFENLKSGPRVTRESLFHDRSMVFDARPITSPSDPEHLYVQFNGGKATRCSSSLPVISQFQNPDELPGFAELSLFRSSVRSMRFLDLSPSIMREPSFPGQTTLGDRGENLSSVLQAICDDESTKRSLLEWLRQLTPLDVVDLDFIPDQIGRILVSLVEAAGQRTSAYSASDGTLRFLAMIAALMGPDPAEFYFLEEIDNGIHPTRLSLLLQLIEQHTNSGRVQVVATTHSPQLLAMLSTEAANDALLVYRQEHESEAHIQRILDIPGAREVLEQRNLARLHESGWLENVVAFSQPEETGT